MSWLTSWCSDALNKRMCRFMIHRYLGHLLKEKLSLEQLSVDLFNGTGFIQSVHVDCEYVNECLEQASLPILLADGYIGEIKVAVPWKTLLEDSCLMEVKHLEVTVRPKSAPNIITAPDLMASMLESMVGSLSSSVDLARSFLNEEQQSSQDPSSSPASSDEGVEAFAHIIDAVLSRMRLRFIDTVIRIESYPPEGAGVQNSDGLGVALELRIDQLEFIDEQLEACQQIGSSAQPITTQPHSLYTVPDLNKLLHLRGVRLYSDIFSRPELAPGAAELLAGADGVTSMYLRRQQAASKHGNFFESSQESSNVFYSCHTGAPGDKTPPAPLTPDLGISFAESVPAPKRKTENLESFLPSNPVQFATFIGERQTVRLRLRNNQLTDIEGLNKKLDVEMFLGGLSMILSPTQVYLLLEVLNTLLEQGSEKNKTAQGLAGLGGKPMGSKEFAQVEEQLQTQIDADMLWKTTDFASGNWSGEEKFYDTSRRPIAKKSEAMNSVNFTSILVNENRSEQNSTSPDLLQPLNIKTATTSLSSHQQSTKSPKSPMTPEKPEVTHCKVRLNSIWVAVTHKDPLGSESKVKTAVEKLQKLAEDFFQESKTVSLSVRSDLTEMRSQLDLAYPADHLRLVGCPAVFDCTLERGAVTENVIFQFSTANCEVLECLSADSVIIDPPEESSTSTSSENEKMTSLSDGEKMHYVELAKFGDYYANEEVESVIDDESEESRGVAEAPLGVPVDPWNIQAATYGEEPSLRLLITNQGRKEHYALSVEMAPCLTELDLSLIDRLYNLVHCYPVFRKGNQPPQRQIGEEALLLEMEKNRRERGSDLSPLPQVRGFDRQLTGGLEVWGVSLSLHLRVRLAQSASPPGNWRSKPLTCSIVDLNLRNYLNMTFKWDFQNKSLCVEDTSHEQIDDNSMNSWGSYFRVPRSADGPFSKDMVMHENEELTLVGNKQEMQEFSSKCLNYSELSILLDLPQVRVVLPGKDFYELLYNRLVNDLAMWEPSCPAYQTRPPPVGLAGDLGAHLTGASQYFSVHVAGLSDQRFGLCKSMAKHTESDDESEDSDGTTLDRSSVTGVAPGGKKTTRKSANRLCFRLRADQGKVLMVLPNLENENSEGELSVAARKGEIFVVSSYQGDPNLVYFYVTLEQAWLWHQNVNETTLKYSKNVSGRGFGHTDENAMPAPHNGEPADLCAAPTPQGMALTAIKEDNFAVAMRLELKLKENLKEMLIAIGLRNTTLHYQPFTSTADWWLTQLVEFFNVPDYPIAGYTMPRTLAELHVHAWSSCLGYRAENKDLNIKSDTTVHGTREPILLRLWVDSADISSYIVQDATALKLYCLFESSKLFLGDKNAGNLKDDFVCLMNMGLFELVVTVIDETAQNAEEAQNNSRRRKTPMLEVRAKNDRVTVWTCPDSLAALGRIARRIAEDTLEGKQDGENEEKVEEEQKNRENVEKNEELKVEEQQKGDLTQSDEEELKETLLNAMEDVKIEKKTSQSAIKTDFDCGGWTEGKARTKTKSSTSTDEEFCMVDEIPGSGIKSTSGEPRIRCLAENEPVEVKANHFTAPSGRTDPLTCLPPGYPQPIIRYLIKDVTVVINLYSGADFCDNAMMVKPYSQISVVSSGGVGANSAKKWIYNKQQQVKGQECRGGPNRDHSVLVELQLSKICFLYELFATDAPAVSRQLLMIQDIEIRDKLALSQINKVLYQYATDKKPRQTQAPMLAVRLLETSPGEAKLKFSLLPLRLNIDQDTLEFLQDFGMEFGDRLKQTDSKRVRATSSTSSTDSGPILEVPTRRAKDAGAQGASSPENSDIQEPNMQIPNLPVLTSSAATLGDIFGDENNEETPDVSKELDQILLTVENSGSEGNCGAVKFTRMTSSTSTVTSSITTTKNDDDLKNSAAELQGILVNTQLAGGLYFNEFEFSPSCTMRLDYHGKQRFDTSQGTVQALLMGLSQLHCTELCLKRLHHRQGLLGVERVAQFAVNQWIEDIRQHQIPQVVGSVGPISSLMQIGQGLRDLIWMPVEEYKKDGHLVKGIQKGAGSFGVSTSSAAIELAQRLVGAVQGVAEFAFDIVSPEYPPARPLTQRNDLVCLRQPADFREGLGMAYDDLRLGVTETTRVLQLAAQEEKAQGRWPLRGILRQATPMVLRPVVVASKATGHLLGGLRSQLKPESRQEELDKWRGNE